MDILTMDREALLAQKARLEAEYAAFKAKGLKLDMSRGKPGSDQLDLSRDMLTVFTGNEDFFDGKTDTRNYGGLEGLMSCRQLFGALLGIPAGNILAGGNSSLTMMYDTLLRLYTFGAAGVLEPWGRQSGLKWLCPAPGYDRHFAITEQLGFEMVTVPMLETGPDMDVVEELIKDPAVKGIWCVPKHSNPQGISCSDETVRRFAALSPAAKDFRIIWDNAYCVHDIGEPVHILNLFEECQKAGTLDQLFIFASTSKFTYPGAGVAMMACSDLNFKWTTDIMGVQAISPDKVNQLRHVRFFGDAAGVYAHMAKHAAILAPKFQSVLDCLSRHLDGTGAGSWITPRGGYFISFDSYPGCAKRINTLCKEAGVVMTGAGATFPKGYDPLDSNLRIAPSLPPLSELNAAMEVFCVCALLAATEKRLSEIG